MSDFGSDIDMDDIDIDDLDMDDIDLDDVDLDDMSRERISKPVKKVTKAEELEELMIDAEDKRRTDPEEAKALFWRVVEEMEAEPAEMNEKTWYKCLQEIIKLACNPSHPCLKSIKEVNQRAERCLSDPEHNNNSMLPDLIARILEGASHVEEAYEIFRSFSTIVGDYVRSCDSLSRKGIWGAYVQSQLSYAMRAFGMAGDASCLPVLHDLENIRELVVSAALEDPNARYQLLAAETYGLIAAQNLLEFGDDFGTMLKWEQYLDYTVKELNNHEALLSITSDVLTVSGPHSSFLLGHFWLFKSIESLEKKFYNRSYGLAMRALSLFTGSKTPPALNKSLAAFTLVLVSVLSVLNPKGSTNVPFGSLSPDVYQAAGFEAVLEDAKQLANDDSLDVTSKLSLYDSICRTKIPAESLQLLSAFCKSNDITFLKVEEDGITFDVQPNKLTIVGFWLSSVLANEELPERGPVVFKIADLAKQMNASSCLGAGQDERILRRAIMDLIDRQYISGYLTKETVIMTDSYIDGPVADRDDLLLATFNRKPQDSVAADHWLWTVALHSLVEKVRKPEVNARDENDRNIKKDFVDF